MRLDTQFQMHNEPEGFDRWNSSFVGQTTPVEREPYIPKYVDVKYVEGSNDKMWSSREFQWTKKLEVCIYTNLKVFNFPECCPDCYLFVSLLRKITREYLEITHFGLIKER